MLYQESNYTAPVDYIVSSYIREYDINKANINILLYYGVINQDQYIEYYNMDRIKRQVNIGKLCRDKNISKILSHGVKEFKKLFFESNNIQDHEVLSIKNDAIFLINKVPDITKFSNIEFVYKNIYTSFYRMGINKQKFEFYYFGDMRSEEEYVHVKGIKDEQLNLHKDYFLEFLLTIFNTAQLGNIEEVINMIQLFYSKYINMELDIGYYREFNANSNYIINSPHYKLGKFEALHLGEHSKNLLHVACNANIIIHFYKMFSTMYFYKK